MSPTNSPPPWEALLVVANHLDPKTLAVASCTCKSWSLAMSSDNLWKPICDAHYPSLSILHSADNTVSFCHLFSVGRAASKLRHGIPPKPRLTLTSLIFVVHVSTPELSIATVAKLGSELEPDPNGLFEFEMINNNAGGGEFLLPSEIWEGNGRVTWNVAVRGWGAAFTMMESCGKVRLAAGAEWWLSEQLPPPRCCSSVGGASSGVVADVKLVLSGENQRKIKVESVIVGMMSTVNWRYLRVDDGLRYLQRFLAPVELNGSITS